MLQHLLQKECPIFDSQPFELGPPLKDRRIAIVTTAGLTEGRIRTFSSRYRL